MRTGTLVSRGLIAWALLDCGSMPVSRTETCPVDDAGPYDSQPGPYDAAPDDATDGGTDVPVVRTMLDRDVGAAPYNARGDGTTDDTAAIQRALDDAGRAVALTGTPPPRAAVVYLPAGNYSVHTHLAVPSYVTLMGSYRAPPGRSSLSRISGTTLFATEGSGSAAGTAFITLAADATLQDVAVEYPGQSDSLTPHPYPWTVRAAGPRVTVRDVMLLNPWQAIDLASATTDGHLLHGIYGQPLNTGILVDHCAAGGRIEDVHFWPFWSNNAATARGYQIDHAVALFLLHAEGETISSFFEIGMHTGVRFGGSHADTCPAGLSCGTNGGTISHMGFDTTSVCFDVFDTNATGWNVEALHCVIDASTDRIGIWRHSGSTATMDIHHASFWGGSSIAHEVLWASPGTLTLDDAVMVAWNPANAAIDVRAGTVAVSASHFGDDVGVALAAAAGTHVSAVGNLLIGDQMTGPITSRANAQ